MFKYLSAAAVTFAMLTAPMASPVYAEAKQQTEAQKKAAENRKKCSKEWADAKAAKKVERGMTWPKFNGACMKRLSAT
jgi:Ni/Co efflux regulator RcnB